MAACLEEESFYHCSVCLDDMTERNPRLLACHHSFCEECLKKLVKIGNIECPSCRHVTPVKANDVSKLSKNFMLLGMKEREKKLLASPKKVTLCQLCGREPAEYKCLDCNELMCQTCNVKHSKALRFKNHKVVVKCANHDEGISHVCVKCVKEACSKCIIVDHSDHDDRVHVYQDGMGLLHSDLENYTSVVNRQMKSLETILKEDQKKMKTEKEQQQSLQEKRDWYLAEAAKIKDILDNMNIKHAKQVIIHREYKEVLKMGNEVTRNTQVFNKTEGREFLLAYHGIKTNVEYANDKINQVRMKYDDTCVPMQFSLSANLGGIAGQKTCLQNPKPVVTFTTETHFKLTAPWQIARLDNDLLAIADFKETSVLIVNYDGKVMMSYKVDGTVRSVYSNDGKTLCIVQDNVITSVCYPSTNTKTYHHGLYIMRGMFVLDHTKYIIYNNATVCEYEPKRNKVKQVIRGLNNCFMCIPYKDTDTSSQRYIVIDDNYREDNIKVYNDRWILTHSFGPHGRKDGMLDSPRRAVIVEDNLLVCDKRNNRVSCFSLVGEFRFHVLTEKEGIRNSFGIEFAFPYLWISETLPGAVKCFNIARCD